MSSDEKDLSAAELGQKALDGQRQEGLDRLLAASSQTEHLLHAILTVSSDFDLYTTTSHLVATARELIGCRSAALAIVDSDVNPITSVYAGIDAITGGRNSSTPTAASVLGLILDRTSPLRLDNLAEDPATAGITQNNPSIRAFLGVPIMIRGRAFGGLYLTDDRLDWTFTASDEIAVQALAAAAAIAIDNAQLFERSERRTNWIRASREIMTQLLMGTDSPQHPLQLIAEQVQKLTDAEQAIVLTPVDSDLPADDIDTLFVSAAVGVHAHDVTGQQVPVEGSTSGQVFRSGASLITESFRYPIQAFTDAGERSAIVMPLRYERTVIGVIAVARSSDQTPFDASDLELVGDFASQAALALVLTANRENAREVSILADRERIAHDLHDHVIQRLFAIGLDVQGTIARTRSPELVERLNRTIDDMQSTIEDIRTTIFELHNKHAHDAGFRSRIQDAVASLTENRDVITTLHMSGPMTAVGPELAQHAEAVVIEAVSNAVRHSGASHLTIDVSIGDDLVVDVIDDGCGISADNDRRSGLTNLRRRAEQVGGACDITSPASGGTRVRWTTPLIDS